MLCVIAVCRARGPCGLAAPGTSKITGSEGWDNSQERWRLIDAQPDAVWQNRLQLDDGVLDIGRHRFLVVAMHGRTVVPVKSTRNYGSTDLSVGVFYGPVVRDGGRRGRAWPGR